MKKKVYLNNLVQGDEHEITENEIRYIEASDGTIDLQKRDANGVFKSIVKGGSVVADPTKPITNSLEDKRFYQAYETLISLSNTGGNISPIYKEELGIIRSYLPEQVESTTTNPNIIGFVGYKTPDGGFKIANGTEALVATIVDDQGAINLKLTHF